MSPYDEIARVLEQARGFSRSLRSKELARQFESISGNWQRMIDLATATSGVIDRTNALSTWNAGAMRDRLTQLQIPESTLRAMVSRLTVAARLYEGIDSDFMTKFIGLPAVEIQEFQTSVCRMAAGYATITESMTTPADIAHLPSFVVPDAAREVFVTGHAAKQLRISERAETERDPSELQLVAQIEEETTECIALLEAVDPGLARPYLGACHALRGANPDRGRHVLSSLRELWNHLLRRIAPDEEVLEWVPKDDKELLHNGKPTRRARILFVCRDLNHGPLSEFVAQDAHAWVALFNLLNRMHQLEPSASDAQLRAVLLRTDSWLTYILQIWNETQT